MNDLLDCSWSPLYDMEVKLVFIPEFGINKLLCSNEVTDLSWSKECPKNITCFY